MKKLFSFLFCVCFVFNSSAQFDDIKFGFIGGVNATYLVGDDGEDIVEDYDDYVDYIDDQSGSDAEGGIVPRIGMHLGLTLDYPLDIGMGNLSLSSGLIYSQRGFALDLDVDRDAYDIYSGWGPSGPYYTTVPSQSVETHLSINLNYVDIPLSVKYHADGGFHLSAGVMISKLVSDVVTMKADGDDANDIEDNFDDVDDYEDYFDEDPEETLNGMHVGVGYTFNEKFTLLLNIQKTGEFGDIGNDDENENLTFQLSTGISF